MKAAILWLVGGALALAGCQGAALPNESFACTASSDCTAGFVCQQGVCVSADEVNGSSSAASGSGTSSSGSTSVGTTEGPGSVSSSSSSSASSSSSSSGSSTATASSSSSSSAASTSGSSSGSTSATDNGSTGSTATSSASSSSSGSTNTTGTTGTTTITTTGTSSSSSGSSGTTGVTCNAGQGTITVDLLNEGGSGDDFQALVAVANGTPYMKMTAANPFIWNEEQSKSWYTLNNTISQAGGVTQNYSVCVPPGTYTLQYWDVCGGGGPCSLGEGFNAGTPPATTYGGGWQIGDSSRPLAVSAGQVTYAHLQETQTNVPTDNFYGGYAYWAYGDCSGGQACPSGTTCNAEGACVDTGYDWQSCGTIDSACGPGQICCVGACSDINADNNNCGGCGVVCGPGTSCSSGQCAATAGGCGIVVAEVARDFTADPTNYEGVFAVANGAPDQNTSTTALWNVEKNKSWYTLDSQVFTDPEIRYVYETCLAPGNYTLQFWNDGCINNGGGCGTFDNGIPPNILYTWEIGDSTLNLPVASGGRQSVLVTQTTSAVPTYDNFYGSYALWSYGGCGSYTPPSSSTQTVTCPGTTSCYQGTCYDFTHDIRHCGSGTNSCQSGESCCASSCTDNDTDNNNCGACGIVCSGAQHCVSGQCQ